MFDSTSVAVVILSAVDGAIFLYAAYWAFQFRDAFATRIYRRQASWVGAIASYFAAFFVLVMLLTIVGISSLEPDTPLGDFGAAFIYLGVAMFFVWIDSSMRIARRSDPLLRDTLHWSRLRWFLGFLVLVGTFFALVFNGATALAFFLASPLYGPIGGLLLLGAIALLRSATRSADVVLRSHLKWFGLHALFLWATSTTGSEIASHNLVADQGLLQVISLLAFALSAYFLYRSARSLAPVAPLPAAAELAPEPAPTTKP